MTRSNRPPSFVGCDDVRYVVSQVPQQGKSGGTARTVKSGSETCDLWICRNESERRMFFIFINITEVLL